jgi:hypothetical protein
MTMRDDTADPYAKSHEGDHGDFKIFWAERGAWLDYHKDNEWVKPMGHPNPKGWYISIAEGPGYGPYATSQAAFCDAKEAVDKLIAEEK